MKISEIKNPNFLKNMDEKELENLAHDMRKFILENVSITGGHLSSNLGIVDLTIAMLKVFDASKDIILFDVGHEAYPYKILTGRAQRFNTLRKKGGLTGFQSKEESEYDHYETGHSSTSISSGLGFALARDLDKKKYNVISVVGDGSFANGLCWEALNQIGDLGTKQIIILNDNQMSISQNVGAMHNLLDKIRGDKAYEKVKKRTKSLLYKSYIGRPIYKVLDFFKDSFKKIYLKNGSMFNDLGIEYYGPINGHDYKEMLKYLNIAKNENKPVILHIITQKGKGYKYAEEDKEGIYHGTAPFDIESGKTKLGNLPSYSEVISSYVYNFAKKDKDIICITPGMMLGSKLGIIKEKLPKQFIDVGIAEEHAALLANTLALGGKKPFLFIYSTFLQRAYDEIVHDIARCNSDVTFCIDRSGFVPEDGASHQGVFDIPMMMSIPNMVISMPKDANEANNLIYTSILYKGPFAIRYPKCNIKYDFEKTQKLAIGSWDICKEGRNCVIISYGDFVNKALEISDILSHDKINVGVVNARFLKPIDINLFKSLLNKNIPIIVYEESLMTGSLASILTLESQKYDFKNKIYSFGIKDEYLKSASRDELIKMQNLDIDSMVNNIKKILK